MNIADISLLAVAVVYIFAAIITVLKILVMIYFMIGIYVVIIVNIIKN